MKAWTFTSKAMQVEFTFFKGLCEMETQRRSCHLHAMHLKSTDFYNNLLNKKLIDLIDIHTKQKPELLS
jgi:hypothetical protein